MKYKKVLLLREHFARTEKQLSDIRKDNAEFRSQILQDFNAFTEKINTRLDKLETAVGFTHNDTTDLKHYAVTQHQRNLWLLSIIVMLFMMPKIITNIKALFTAISEGISVFRQDSK